MLLRAFGKKKYCTLIQQNLDQTNYLAKLIEKNPELELTAPVASNVVCFRYKQGNLNEVELEKLDREIPDDSTQSFLDDLRYNRERQVHATRLQREPQDQKTRPKLLG